MDLLLHDHEHDGATVLLVGGEVDLATAPALRTRLVQLLTAGRAPVVVDLEGVTMLDSLGLGVLVGASARAESLGRALVLVCPQGRVRDLLVRTRLHGVLPLADDVPGALARLEAAPGGGQGG